MVRPLPRLTPRAGIIGLGALVLASALVRLWLGRRVAAPWIMVDELIYSELAKSFAASGEFRIRDQPAGGYGVVYPVLISPAFGLFDAVPTAYAAAKAINALVMSLAAVPAYALARRVLAPGPSLVAALLTVAVPSLVYTGMLMTENLFYPVFLTLALALVAVLERPTTLRVALLLAAILLGLLTRVQVLALLPAVATAPVLLVVLGRRGLRGLVPFRLLYGALGVAFLVVAGAQLLRGRPFLSLLGAYRSVGEEDYSVGATARWLVYHLAELDLYVGVIPFAALLALCALRLSAALVAATLALSLWLLLAVAAFAAEVPEPPRILERSTFVLAPLLFIALLVWIDLGVPRPVRAALPAALAAAALPVLLPYERLVGPPAVADTLALLPLWRLSDGAGFAPARLDVAVALAASLAAALFLLVPRRAAAVLPALVLAAFLLALPAVQGGPRGVERAAANALAAGIGLEKRDWIDRAAGDEPVAVLWSGRTPPYTVWENEFFNRSVAEVLLLDAPLPGRLPEQKLAGKPVRARYVLTDGSATVAGILVAEDRARGLLLTRAHHPIRLTTVVRGLYPGDTWSGRTVTYVREPCRRGTLTVVLETDPTLFVAPQTVTALRRRVSIPPRGTRRLSVPLEPRAGRCTVTFDVARTVRAKGDPRPLGAHFRRFDYEPRP